jgi:glutathione S-transferase
MTDDRRTKAQILDELTRVQARLTEFENRPVARVERIPAADALAGCIRALEPLARDSSQSGYSYNRPKFPELENVLKHLLDRYGVDLTVRITEPCNRNHVDDAPDELLIHALRTGRTNGDMGALFR